MSMQCGWVKRLYDRAPLTYLNQNIQAYSTTSLPAQVKFLYAEACCDQVQLQNQQITPAPQSANMKRVCGWLTVPATLYLSTRNGDLTTCVTLYLPVDTLIRIPQVAPYELIPLLTKLVVRSVETTDGCIISLCVDACAALCVVVDSPCEPCPPVCPPPRPNPCPPACPPPRPNPCPPVCPPPRPNPCPPACPPPRPIPCPPEPECCWPPPPKCLPLFPPDRHDCC